MIITDDFVMLNWPKSGSTFAREVLKQIHDRRDRPNWAVKLRLKRPSLREVMVVIKDKERIRRRKGQHGTVRHIPQQDRDKPIVSIIRDPLSRYVSTYHYRYWTKFPHAEPAVLQREFPNWPDLSFEQYLLMCDKYSTKNRLRTIQPAIEMGVQSIQFIQMYSPDPDAVLKRIDDDYIENRRYVDDMAPVRFLHQENLRAELHEFLLGIGYCPEEAALVETLEKKRVSDRKGDRRPDIELYSPALLENVLKREAFLFKLFPEYVPAAAGTSQSSECR